MKKILILAAFCVVLQEVQSLVPCENFPTSYNNRCFNVTCSLNRDCQSGLCMASGKCDACTNTDSSGSNNKCEGNKCSGNNECKLNVCYNSYCDAGRTSKWGNY